MKFGSIEYRGRIKFILNSKKPFLTGLTIIIGRDESRPYKYWIPAYAGMTDEGVMHRSQYNFCIFRILIFHGFIRKP